MAGQTAGRAPIAATRTPRRCTTSRRTSDTNRVRVAGPFTVESLSPHRVLDTDAPQPATEAVGKRDGADLGTMILDNLRVAGVQNTRKGERLRFDQLDPYVGEEAKRFGQRDVLPVRMNADLLMGDALLQKTGAGNSFMVFGEPDIEIRTLPENLLEVELRGLDMYDPATVALLADSNDGIACRFIDTAYDAERFFGRRAHFTGADEPYDSALRHPACRSTLGGRQDGYPRR